VASSSFTAQATTETGTVTIVDDDGAVEWLVKDGTQLEQSAVADSGVRLTVMRTGTEANLTNSGAAQTIKYATAAATGASETLAGSGTDFTAANGTLTFAATELDGAINDTVTSIVVDDITDLATGGGVVTIQNEDISYTGITNATKTLTGVTRGVNGTAAASHADEAAANVTGVYVDVVTTHDTESEIAENFAVTLNTASAGTITDATGIGTIIDNDANTVTFGNALNFDGIEDLIDIPGKTGSPEVANNVAVTSNYTMEAWIYTTKALDNSNSSTTYEAVMTKGDYDYQFGLSDSINTGEEAAGKHNLFFYENTSPHPPAASFTQSKGSSVGVSLNSWTHVAVSNDGTNHKLYLDGALVDTEAATGMGTGINALILGASLVVGEDGSNGKDDYTDWFKGAIDDVRLWGEAKTGTEINANKKVALRGDEEGLIGYWKLDNTLTDSAGLGSGDGIANDGKFWDGNTERSATYLVDNSVFIASTAGDGDPIVLDLDGKSRAGRP
jgi:hypothetical protein